MEDKEREEWIKTIKEGDKVYSSDYDTWNRENRYYIFTIKKITTTGKIRLNNDVLLNNNGIGNIGDTWNQTHYKIYPLTEDIINAIETQKYKGKLIVAVQNKLDNLRCRNLNMEDLIQLNELLDSFNKENK